MCVLILGDEGASISERKKERKKESGLKQQGGQQYQQNLTRAHSRVRTHAHSLQLIQFGSNAQNHAHCNKPSSDNGWANFDTSGVYLHDWWRN